MPYATRSDLVTAFGAAEVSGLEAQGRDIAAALAAAIATADSYLSSRYQVPLTAANAILTRVVCDIARFQLFGVSAEGEPEKRNAAAIAWLRDVAASRASIEGAAAAESTVGSAVPGRSPARAGQAVSGFEWSRY